MFQRKPLPKHHPNQGQTLFQTHPIIAMSFCRQLSKSNASFLSDKSMYLTHFLWIDYLLYQLKVLQTNTFYYSDVQAQATHIGALIESNQIGRASCRESEYK